MRVAPDGPGSADCRLRSAARRADPRRPV